MANDIEPAPRPRAIDRSGSAFGDGEMVSIRLALLADVFAPASRSLLALLAGREVTHVVDLGCGPGNSTRMLTECFRGAHTLGLDVSISFLETACAGVTAARFALHDVSKPPLPGPPPDLCYARFVLSHLGHPERVLNGWITGLSATGVVVVEEDERIETDEVTLRHYLSISERAVRDHGGDLFLGRRLHDFAESSPCTALIDRIYRLEVPSSLAALMFSMNLTTLRADEAVRSRIDEAAIAQLSDELCHLSVLTSSEPVAFVIRQVVLARADV